MQHAAGAFIGSGVFAHVGFGLIAIQGVLVYAGTDCDGELTVRELAGEAAKYAAVGAATHTALAAVATLAGALPLAAVFAVVAAICAAAAPVMLDISRGRTPGVTSLAALGGALSTLSGGGMSFSEVQTYLREPSVLEEVARDPKVKRKLGTGSGVNAMQRAISMILTYCRQGYGLGQAIALVKSQTVGDTQAVQALAVVENAWEKAGYPTDCATFAQIAVEAVRAQLGVRITLPEAGGGAGGGIRRPPIMRPGDRRDPFPNRPKAPRSSGGGGLKLLLALAVAKAVL